MGILVLNELNKELTRLCIAGSSIGKEDNRIKEYIPILNKIGENVPIIKLLVSNLENILNQINPSENLMEAIKIVYSILPTQGAVNTDNYMHEIGFPNIFIKHTKLTRSNIEEIQNELLYDPDGCGKEIHELYEHNLHNDTRLYEIYCGGITDNKSTVSNFLEYKVIPSIGRNISPFLEEKLDINGTKKDARLFKLLYEIKGKNILPLTLKVLEEGSKVVQAQAIYTLWEFKEYEDVLLDYAKKGKGDIKKAAFTALIKMKSQKGEEFFSVGMKKTNIGHLYEALEFTENIELVNLAIDKIKEDLESYDTKSSKINKLLNVIVKRDDLEVINYISSLYEDLDFYRKVSGKINLRTLSEKLEEHNTRDKNKMLYNVSKDNEELLDIHINMCFRLLSEEEIYKRCSQLMKNGYKDYYVIISNLIRKHNVEGNIWSRKWGELFLSKGYKFDIDILLNPEDKDLWLKLLDLWIEDTKENISYYYEKYLRVGRTIAKAFNNNVPNVKDYYEKFIEYGYRKDNLDHIIFKYGVTIE